MKAITKKIKVLNKEIELYNNYRDVEVTMLKVVKSMDVKAMHVLNKIIDIEASIESYDIIIKEKEIELEKYTTIIEGIQPFNFDELIKISVSKSKNKVQGYLNAYNKYIPVKEY